MNVESPKATWFEPGTAVAVLTTQPGLGVLDYIAPEGGVVLGALVEVPLGPRHVMGAVWGAGESGLPHAKLRAMRQVLDVAPLSSSFMQYLRRAGGYTMTPEGQMLRLATRAPGLSEPPAPLKLLVPTGVEPTRMTDARLRVLDAIETFDGPVAPGELAREAGTSTAVVKGLVKAGALREVPTPRDAPYPQLDPNLPGKALSVEQQHAADHLRKALAERRYTAHLLQGVTGSGKTEVYLEAVAACLAQGRQALVMLPEIALTEAFLQRVETRFGAPAAEWHSAQTGTARRRLWRMVGKNQAQLVVGARSALFLPFADLGLIVVDEEHDNAYKQEEGALYNARDMAVLRASFEQAAVVLASATPSLESWVNAKSGKYQRLRLTARHGAAVLPEMRPVDMRMEGMARDRWISSTLAQATAATFERGEQALWFLNRRGYAPLTLCRSCGHQIECPNCSARMVEHRFRGEMLCHLCGTTMKTPTTCPECGAEDSLAPIGPGVERITEEAQALFPDARIALLSSDQFRSAQALKTAIAQIADGDADLIIGTQLVAKGHNFPKLTLVGVVDADIGLHGSDLRAAERSFQLIRQVAGRAGRADKPGLALVQTHQPDHAVMKAIISGDEEAFWRAEAVEREAFGMPPFGRLAGIVMSCPDEQRLQHYAQDLAREGGILERAGATLLGPAPAPILRIRNRYRWRFLVKAHKSVALQPALAEWVGRVKLPSNLRVNIDIDPQSFY